MGQAKPTAVAGRTRRAALTRESILEAALHVCSPEGGAVLTFNRLGKELGADPTAVYRHFRDKDELVLALSEVLVRESEELAAADAPGREDWRGWLTATARALRTVYLRRPVLAVLAAGRTTAGPAETESVEEIIGVLHQAGLPVIEAAECYRMAVDLTLAFIHTNASFLVLDADTQAKDDTAWAVKYGLLPADRFPLLQQSAARLTELFRKDEEVFEMVLSTFLDGVALRIERARG
ncbi:TetR/AcrR family transcriptional regulator [Streptomyces sp. NPDC090052]|uniref:TetR/AcrR family transcriptional regulator n=1 Tax=unclassified Streptomyces TaxID=2593676 RepID=UPI0022585D19|nr:TetR/AcrR family transcriptional regulator [Streptomyces sp. NBC_01306]MCX4722344.1 TetR/AcrR family transcriptional regulator [Streptomyces sp. NBC_01306]WSV07993.1 TetR/AcrR family transcriptional regulator [Streptomyces sp. NBC_01020]WSX46081.1 TetR/AcrR family transcriptional regulator [Streptomyces sp. NBC_00963]WSX65848.1 TetR/AcrR family transcriptional regulator [Streptomyces sp. NBC_00932]